MAKAGRLAGSILMESENEYYIVGDIKEPCKWEERGFADPGERNVLEEPWLRLSRNSNDVKWDDDATLVFSGEGSRFAEKLVDSFMIFRNGSISERLWGLVTESSEQEENMVNAQWLIDTPDDIWEIVRDSVLRC